MDKLLEGVTKEQFYWVWQDSTKEDVLNQYYADYKYTLNLKNRINKAIEYIKSYKNDYAPYELSDYNIRELLNILEGSDKE